MPNATEENVNVFSNLDVPAASKSDSIERSKHTEIAFVISVAKCEAAANGLLLDGPAVLAESTRLVQSKYHNDLIAFVHPNATSCSQRLLFFGYKIVEQDLGFQKHNTSTSRRYRQTIDYKGCCDSLEFKQLEAFTVTEYAAVVHVDTDTLLLKPLDYAQIRKGPNDIDKMAVQG